MGSAANVSTTIRRASAHPYATRATGRPRSIESAPSALAAAPAIISGGNSGTATRFAIGETSDTRPNAAATTGSVGALAASVVASPSRSAPGRIAKRAASGACHSTRPAVAVAESTKPRSAIAAGSAKSMAVTATQSAFAVAARRPEASPTDATDAISAARMTLGARPTSRLYATIAATVATARVVGRARPRSAMATAVPTSVMLKPEIASRCVVPLTANAYARSAETLARSPSTIPSRMPLSGSGTSSRRGRARSARIPSSATSCVMSRPGTGPSTSRAVTPTAEAHAHAQSDRRGRSALASASAAQATAMTVPSTRASGTPARAVRATRTAMNAAGRSGETSRALTACAIAW